MSVDPVKMVPKIHKLSGLVSEVCIRHLLTLFVGYMCVNGGGGGGGYVCRDYFSNLCLHVFLRAYICLKRCSFI